MAWLVNSHTLKPKQTGILATSEKSKGAHVVFTHHRQPLWNHQRKWQPNTGVSTLQFLSRYYSTDDKLKLHLSSATNPSLNSVKKIKQIINI